MSVAQQMSEGDVYRVVFAVMAVAVVVVVGVAVLGDELLHRVKRRRMRRANVGHGRAPRRLTDAEWMALARQANRASGFRGMWAKPALSTWPDPVDEAYTSLPAGLPPLPGPLTDMAAFEVAVAAPDAYPPHYLRTPPVIPGPTTAHPRRWEDLINRDRKGAA
jgi:hypothetical protein